MPAWPSANSAMLRIAAIRWWRRGSGAWFRRSARAFQGKPAAAPCRRWPTRTASGLPVSSSGVRPSSAAPVAGKPVSEPAAVGEEEAFLPRVRGNFGKGAHGAPRARVMASAGLAESISAARPCQLTDCSRAVTGSGVPSRRTSRLTGPASGDFLARKNRRRCRLPAGLDAFVAEQVGQRPVGEQHLLVAEHHDRERQAVEHQRLGTQIDHPACGLARARSGLRGRSWCIAADTVGQDAAQLLEIVARDALGGFRVGRSIDRRESTAATAMALGRFTTTGPPRRSAPAPGNRGR